MSDELRAFDITIEWHTVQEGQTMRIIARCEKDAAEVACMLFSETHAKNCVITGTRCASVPTG